MARKEWSGNAVQAHFAAVLAAGGTSATIDTASGWPVGTYPFVGAAAKGTTAEEKILFSGRSGTTLTVDPSGRGWDGTTDQQHEIGETLDHVVDADTLTDFSRHVYDTSSDDHTQYLNITRHDVSARHAFGAALGTPAAPADVGTTASAGAAAGPSRADHVHAIAAGVVGDGLALTAGVLSVNVDGSTLEINADTLRIKDNGVTNAKMADNSVGSAEIIDDSVGLAEAADAVLSSVASFSRTGVLVTGTGTMRFRFPFAATLKHVRLAVATAPTGADLIVDVNKNGTTVYTTQANRPKVTAGTNNESATTAPDVTAVAAGDYLTVDIDQVGSTVAGADLVVNIYYALA